MYPNNNSFALSISITVITSTCLIAIFFWLVKSWVKTRLLNDISFESNKQLEEYKSKLSNERERGISEFNSLFEQHQSTLGIFSDSFFIGQKLAHQRRLDAIDEAWKGICAIKLALDPHIFFVDYLTEGEVQERCLKGKHRADLEQAQYLMAEPDFGNTVKNVETRRPFLNDSLWILFYLHYSIKCRIVFILNPTFISKHQKNWKSDPGIKQLLVHLFDKKELDEFLQKEVGAIQFLNSTIEVKFLKEARNFISGKGVKGEILDAVPEIKEALQKMDIEKNRSEHNL